ncbi:MULTISPECIES: pyridoxamine 5'-phosphate oxidase family protein [unclassified Streptomyces]|uniref:pyridoxamine 5'-phosphate oxidase family protein n=1 Tax=unclassified Streptomyces TaxID=2593676 RepID=UPI0038185D94
MTTPSRRVIEVPGSEALWLLEGATQGSPVHVRRETPVVRPAVPVLEYGRPVVRTPAQAVALVCRPSLTCHAKEIKSAGGTGWTVTATGPAEVSTDRDEAAHHRRTLPGRAHGPHDTLVRIRPQTVTGFRLADAEAAR